MSQLVLLTYSYTLWLNPAIASNIVNVDYYVFVRLYLKREIKTLYNEICIQLRLFNCRNIKQNIFVLAQMTRLVSYNGLETTKV